MRQTQKTPYLLDEDPNRVIESLKKRLYDLEQKVRGDIDSVSGDIPAMSTQAQAEAGTDEATTMSPKRVLESIEVNQRCKAWVNFNGTGTVVKRADENVDGITDNGTGDYTINLVSGAVEDENYAAVITTGGTSGAYNARTYEDTTARTTSAVRIFCTDASFNANDPAQVSVSIFR